MTNRAYGLPIVAGICMVVSQVIKPSYAIRILSQEHQHQPTVGFQPGSDSADEERAIRYHRRNKRHVAQFAEMIRLTTGREPLLYNSYGNYCGLGGLTSRRPQDSIDACCEVHDRCYGEVEDGACKKDWPIPIYFLHYHWGLEKKNMVEFDMASVVDELNQRSSQAATTSRSTSSKPATETAIVLTEKETEPSMLMETGQSSEVPPFKKSPDAEKPIHQSADKIRHDDDEFGEPHSETWYQTYEIVCTSKDACRRALCECDRIAAECFGQSKYNRKLKATSPLDVFVLHRDERVRDLVNQVGNAPFRIIRPIYRRFKPQN